jgi:hypothetical protein
VEYGIITLLFTTGREAVPQHTSEHGEEAGGLLKRKDDA